MITSATDLGEKGFDANYGHGLIDPSAALESKVVSEDNHLGSLANWITQYRSTAEEEPSDLVVPTEPEPVASEEATEVIQEQENLESVGQSNFEAWLNPLTYWLLAPLAPLLWIVLRRKRKGQDRALKKTKGKPQHDSSDN